MITAGLSPVPRRARRALVLVSYLGYAAMVLAWSLLDAPGRWLLVLPLGLAVATAAGLLLAPQLLGVSDGPDEALDERQIAQRNEHYLNAYRGLGALVVLAAAYYLFASGGEWWLPRSELEVQAFFWGTFIVAVTLPTAVAAWSEEDAPA